MDVGKDPPNSQAQATVAIPARQDLKGDDEETTLLQGDKLLRHLKWSVELRGFAWFLLFTVIYASANAFEIDFQFASATFNLFMLSLNENLGVNADAEPELCSVGTVNGAPCWTPYHSMSSIQDLVGVAYNRVALYDSFMSTLCEGCGFGITTHMRDPEVLNVDTDFICADFGRSRSSGGLPDRDCPLEDASWARAPSKLRSPCCKNATLVSAAFALAAGRGRDPGVRGLEDLLGNASRNMELMETFIKDQVGASSQFLQIIVSRDQRMIGMNYYAHPTDRGWTHDLVTPQIQYWSSRYDCPRLLLAIQVVTMMANIGSLIYDVRARIVSSLSWRAFGRKMLKLDLLLLKLPATLLPLHIGLLRSMLSRTEVINVTSVAELLILMRFFYEGKRFLFQRLLVSVLLALRPIAELMLVLLPLLLVVACIRCQMYGVFLYSHSERSVYWTAFTQLFSEFANGVVMEESAVDANPLLAYLMHYLLTVVLFLTLSQVFITLLMDSFAKASDVVQQQLAARALPEGYVESACQASLCSRVGNEVCHIFVGYLPLYRAWCFPLQRCLRLALAERRAAGMAHPGLLDPKSLKPLLKVHHIRRPHLVVSELCKFYGASKAELPKSGVAPKQGPGSKMEELLQLREAIRLAAKGVDEQTEVSKSELALLSDASLELARAVHAAQGKRAETVGIDVSKVDGRSSL